MKRSIHETFTEDLRYDAERISLEDIENEVADAEHTSNYYNEEELQAIWDTLQKLYKIDDEHYLIMYLMFYLGFSFRKVAAVIGRGPSFVFLYTQQAVSAVQKELGVDSTLSDEESIIGPISKS